MYLWSARAPASFEGGGEGVNVGGAPFDDDEKRIIRAVREFFLEGNRRTKVFDIYGECDRTHNANCNLGPIFYWRPLLGRFANERENNVYRKIFSIVFERNIIYQDRVEF